MRGTWAPNQTPAISCGILGDAKYRFVQWHCHWAKNNFNGSDHTFNGRAYPMECHFVHFREQYGSFQNAALQPDGIAVVGYVFDVRYIIFHVNLHSRVNFDVNLGEGHRHIPCRCFGCGSIKTS